jgi:hypothetical protein
VEHIFGKLFVFPNFRKSCFSAKACVHVVEQTTFVTS